MRELKSTEGMRAALDAYKAGERDQMDAIAKEAGYADYAAFLANRNANRQAQLARRAAAIKSDPEVIAAHRRLSILAGVEAQLRRSSSAAVVDSFTAAMRGYEVDGKFMKALAPNAYVWRLYQPGNGKDGLITREQLIAASDYSCLNDQLKVGGASADPGDIRVDGGGGGSAELSIINRLDAARRFRAAQDALAKSSSVPKWGKLIRSLTDWICLDDGHPLDDFALNGPGFMRGEKGEKASKGMMIAQGLDTLCQHFRKS